MSETDEKLIADNTQSFKAEEKDLMDYETEFGRREFILD